MHTAHRAPPNQTSEAPPRQEDGFLREEGGYIVVETVLGFMLFLFLMVSILSLIHIVTLQNRMHYALTQTAQELSMYSYALEVTGVADKLREVNESAAKARVEISDFKASLEGVVQEMDSLNPAGAYGNAQQVLGQLSDWIDNPRDLFALAGSKLEGLVAHAMIGGYLKIDGMEAGTYLEQQGVVGGMLGLDFSDSVIIDEKGDIELVVHYRVRYSFGALPLPFDELNITQKVRVRPWLAGNGQGWSDYMEAT